MSSLFMRCNSKPRAPEDFLAAYEVFVTLPVFILKKIPVLNWQLCWQKTRLLRLLPSSRRLGGNNCHDVEWRLYSVSRWRRNWMTLGSFSGRGRTRGWVTTNINDSSTRLWSAGSSKNMYVWWCELNWSCLGQEEFSHEVSDLWRFIGGCITSNFHPIPRFFIFKKGFHPDAFWQMSRRSKSQKAVR